MAVITNAQRVILGPLTTTFSRPAPCSTGVGWCATCNVVWYGQSCVPTGVQDGTACWPTTSQGAAQPNPTLKGWGFYSPGVQCPMDYTSACSATAGGATGWSIQFQMAPGETAVGCCPRGFRCANQNGQTCISIATSTTIETVGCTSGTSGALAVAAVPTTVSEKSIPTLNVYAPMIHIAWQASDRPEPTSTGTRTSTTSGAGRGIESSAGGSGSKSDDTGSSGGDATPGTSTGTAGVGGGKVLGGDGGVSGSGSGASELAPGSSGLGSGAIAGISIGAALVILAIIAAAVFVWWKKRQHGAGRRNGAEELPGSTAWPASPMNAGSTTVLQYVDKPTELSGVGEPRYEVAGAPVSRYEAPGMEWQTQELPGQVYK
jgi:hypothetical protein